MHISARGFVGCPQLQHRFLPFRGAIPHLGQRTAWSATTFPQFLQYTALSLLLSDYMNFWKNQTKPAPRINLMLPKNIAMLHKTIPVIPMPFLPLEVAVATILIISPMKEKGILAQFIHPKNGVNATNMPIIAKIPHIRLTTCMGPADLLRCEGLPLCGYP